MADDKTLNNDNIAEAEYVQPATRTESAGVTWNADGVPTNSVGVFNVSTTRAGMKIALGNIQDRDSEGKPTSVAVSNQIFLNPAATKRLIKLLSSVVSQHEQRYPQN